jgi:hypothetical protein
MTSDCLVLFPVFASHSLLSRVGPNLPSLTNRSVICGPVLTGCLDIRLASFVQDRLLRCAYNTPTLFIQGDLFFFVDVFYFVVKLKIVRATPLLF